MCFPLSGFPVRPMTRLPEGNLIYRNRMVKHRNHILFTDSSFNSHFTVRLNLYQNFLFAAMKIVNYIKSWGLDVKGRHAFVFRTNCSLLDGFS
jgi:hypothetical protein